MNTTTPDLLNLYFPLWGAEFDSEGVGIIAPGVACYIPDAEEWRTVQKTDVWMAQWHASGGTGDGPAPPCCIVAITDLEDPDSIHAGIDSRGPLLLAAARNAVTTLRLFRPGWFLQPEQAMYVYYAPSSPVNVVRAPGPYRQAFVGGTFGLPMPPYKLSLADLTQDIDVPCPITRTSELIANYNATGGNDSVAIAIESFNRSYGYQLRAASRAANLFTALDAMLGGMSARKIGRVQINSRGFARRVETALSSTANPAFDGDPGLEARWLNTSGRELRNAIAHGNGRASESDAAAAQERLQALVRCVLRQYLQFAVPWLTEREAIAGRLDISPDSLLAAAYVTALEAQAKQPGSTSDLLQ
jgi:hypothetical protein